MKECAIFIDGGYIEKVLRKNFNNAKVDYLKFSELILDDSDNRLRTYYYHCPPYQSDPPTSEERERKSGYDKFKYSLQRLPRFQVREGKLVYRNGRYEQKRVDTLLCVDLVHLTFSNKIDKAIIVSGDSDLSPGIEKIKDSMVLTTLVYHASSCSDELYTLCDERKEITEEMIEKSKRS